MIYIFQERTERRKEGNIEKEGMRKMRKNEKGKMKKSKTLENKVFFQFAVFLLGVLWGNKNNNKNNSKNNNKNSNNNITT